MNGRYQLKIASRKRTIVDLDDFPIKPNAINFVFGESGIGKSLSARALCGLIDPEQLSVAVNGLDYREYLESSQFKANREYGFFVFQEPSTHLNPLLRLADQLYEGSLNSNYDDAKIMRTLWDDPEDEQLRKLLAVYPKPFRPSGGEKQRVLLAMAFKKINRFIKSGTDVPALFVFDEPTGNLDDHFRNMFLKLLFDRFKSGTFTVLFITHDYSMISEIYSRFPDMKPHVHFTEMARQNGGLRVREFSPEEYLFWLKQQKAAEIAITKKSKPVLKLLPPVHIFGREMYFTRRPGSKQRVSLNVHAGEMVYLKAASGVGKTTLLKILMGLIPAQQLQCEIGQWPLTARTDKQLWPQKIWAKEAGMVFQHADEALNPESRVKEIFNGLKIPPPVPSLTEMLGLLFDVQAGDRINTEQKIKHLSGGQKQRLNLLRTLVLKPPLLLLDEPLNGLDLETIKKVLAHLRQVQRGGTGILLVSHNEEIFDALVPESSVYYLHATESNA